MNHQTLRTRLVPTVTAFAIMGVTEVLCANGGCDPMEADPAHASQPQGISRFA